MQHGTETKVEFKPAAGLEWSRPLPDEDLTVPLVDEHEAGRIYDPSLLRWALWGAVIGVLLLGGLGYGLANGSVAVTGLGQWASSGTAVGAVAGGGLGLATGALAGALLALYRMPARRPDEQEAASSSAVTLDRAVDEPARNGP